MVTLVKHEWHQVDSQFAYELTDDILAEIYPDLDEDELTEKMRQIEEGEISVEEILEDADNEGVDIEWDRQYDDWWTERKGGYDVTYELGDDDSWHTPDPEPEHTHKCTKCKWSGQSYEAEWHWPEEDSEDAKLICPYCESDLELTAHGKVDEEAKKKRMAEIDAMFAGDDDAS